MTLDEKEKLYAQLKDLHFNEDYDFFIQAASKDQTLFIEIFNFLKTLKEKDQWRILWLLDHASENNFDYILPILNDLYKLVLKTNNESNIRQGMKLIFRHPIDEEYAGELLERCIQWMLNPKAKISTQVSGLEFFYRTTLLYPELKNELLTYIDQIMEESPSAGYKNRLSKIKNELLKSKT